MGFVDEEGKRLTAAVEKLESRIKALEERAFGGAAQQSQDIRMILMGPPGAGAFCRCSFPPTTEVERGSGMADVRVLTFAAGRRQGHSSSQDQGEVLVLSSGRSIGVAWAVVPQGRGRDFQKADVFAWWLGDRRHAAVPSS